MTKAIFRLTTRVAHTSRKAIIAAQRKMNTMNITDWIGSAAAALTTTSFIPQAWKIWRTRHTADISLGMYAFFTFGVALWLIYGILLASWPIIIANSITLLLAGTVLVMKLKFG
jgi:MtN3 and saliva related transmembrane protein